MWRTPEWKLVRDSRRGMDELYHLTDDPGELYNLIDDPSPNVREVINQLDRALRGRMKEIEGS